MGFCRSKGTKNSYGEIQVVVIEDSARKMIEIHKVRP